MKIKKKKVVPMNIRVRRAKDKLWELCKQFTRNKYGGKCYTCNSNNLVGSNQQTGHGIPDAVGGARLRYHPNNLRIQCTVCNIHYSGQGGEFYRHQVIELGQERVDKLYQLKNKNIKADILFYLDMISLYEKGNESDIINYLENL